MCSNTICAWELDPGQEGPSNDLSNCRDCVDNDADATLDSGDLACRHRSDFGCGEFGPHEHRREDVKDCVRRRAAQRRPSTVRRNLTRPAAHNRRHEHGAPYRQWCDGEYYAKSPEWQGQSAVKSVSMCLPPLADGTCELCPTAKVTKDVEDKLLEYLVEFRPMCKPDHWELGCMRTIENALLIGYEPDYCCFEVALWGDGCEDQP